jgi:hypothetical protein
LIVAGRADARSLKHNDWAMGQTDEEPGVVACENEVIWSNSGYWDHPLRLEDIV